MPPPDDKRDEPLDVSLEEVGDLSPQEFRRRAHDLVDWIAAYLESTREHPVLSRSRPGDLLDELPSSGPEEPRDWADVREDLDSLIVPGITHWNHPGFLAYFANTGSVPGILGSMLATALNPNGMLWRTSPAATELEQRVLAWLAEWLGLPASWFGIINDTASTSSLCALAAARQRAPGYSRADGVVGMRRPLRLYLSEQAHSSIDKAAILMGLGQSSLRRIEVGADYAMDPHALADAVRDDLAAGRQPFAVVATAGTTSSTSVDPIDAIADVCEDFDLWLHVDAAYAGAAALLPEYRDLLAGWQRADSVVVNPHKWLFTPMCCSLLYTPHPRALREAFSLVPEYLRSDVGDDRGGRPEPAQPEVDASVDAAEPSPVDYMNYGVQLGRPFRALKLWMVVCTYGRRGLQDRLRHQCKLAAEFAARVDAHDDFERLAPTPFSTVCFRYRPGAGPSGDGTELGPVTSDEMQAANESILATVNADGEVFLSHTRLRGRLALRLSVGNLRTERRDVEAAWAGLLRAAEHLPLST